jgi:hypothetical protein
MSFGTGILDCSSYLKKFVYEKLQMFTLFHEYSLPFASFKRTGRSEVILTEFNANETFS